MRKFSVYILRFQNNSFYTGITENLPRRLLEHLHGQCRSTRFKKLPCLIYLKNFETRILSRQWEKHIKGIGARRFLRSYHSRFPSIAKM
jgi:predicted GIY-YIG superfamily endonuclease